MKYKALAACVGFIVVGSVTYLLHDTRCLFALIPSIGLFVQLIKALNLPEIRD